MEIRQSLETVLERRMAEISKALRKDREIAFYGAEDLIPSEFYTEADATRASYDRGRGGGSGGAVRIRTPPCEA